MSTIERLPLAVDHIPEAKRPSTTPSRSCRRRDLVITFGRVIGLDGVDVDLYRGEVLAVIGDNGAGKSTLIKCLTGAYQQDSGEVLLDGQPVDFKRPQDAREAGIETVYQQLAVIPALDIASNLYLAREERRPGPLGSVLRMLDKKGMKERAGESVQKLGIQTIQNMGQAVETLSGGQRQAVAVARAAAFGSKVVVLDEPTAALGVKESGWSSTWSSSCATAGLAVILISHNMPHVWEAADRIHIQRLGGCAGVITAAVPRHGRGRGDHDRRQDARAGGMTGAHATLALTTRDAAPDGRPGAASRPNPTRRPAAGRPGRPAAPHPPLPRSGDRHDHRRGLHPPSRGPGRRRRRDRRGRAARRAARRRQHRPPR